MNQSISFENLSHATMAMSAQAIIAAADIVLMLWPDGEIADITFGGRTRLSIDPADLRGLHVAEIADEPDRSILETIVADARKGTATSSTRICHSKRLGSGTTATYSAHLAQDGKNIVLIGHLERGGLELAERVIDAEISRTRRRATNDTEARYQALFETTSEGLLIIDCGTGRIEDANGQAARLLDSTTDMLIGSTLNELLSDESDAIPFLELAGSSDLTKEVTSLSGRNLCLSSKLVRSFDRTLIFARLSPVRTVANDDNEPDFQIASQLLRRTSVPIALTDLKARIVWSNPAFAALVPDRPIVAESISDILGLSKSALEVALRAADDHGRLMTSLNALDTSALDMEDMHVSVVAIPEDAPNGYGFVIHLSHEVGQEQPTETTISTRVEASALAEMVGQASMKALVRRSTSEIEKQCIVSALRLTDNNRTEAAGVLGLSRQSFYKKLHEHGLV